MCVCVCVWVCVYVCVSERGRERERQNSIGELIEVQMINRFKELERNSLDSSDSNLKLVDLKSAVLVTLVAKHGKTKSKNPGS